MSKNWERDFDHPVSRQLVPLSENIPHLFLISFHSHSHALAFQTWFPCPLTFQTFFPWNGVNGIELSVLRCNEISILRSAKNRSVVYNGVYMVQHFSQTQSSKGLTTQTGPGILQETGHRRDQGVLVRGEGEVTQSIMVDGSGNLPLSPHKHATASPY